MRILSITWFSIRIITGTIHKAVLFLGWASIVLVVGSIALAGYKITVPGALWGALGTGIGGLAGIFMGKRQSVYFSGSPRYSSLVLRFLMDFIY